jgi:hypothetical protein
MKKFEKGKNGAPRKKGGAPAAGAPAVLFPGPEGWELWSALPSQPVCTGPAEEPGNLRPGVGCVVCLPSRSFFSLPLWVPMVEESPAREQTQIKLEMKGMLGANPESAVWNFEPIRRELLPAPPEGEAVTRQLEATAVLAVPFKEEWLVEEASRYEPAGRMLPAPRTEASGVLRRELGRWVADFYQEGKWLHSQTLLAPVLDGSAAVELAATAAQLEEEGTLGRLEDWVVRDAEAIMGADFREGLGAPVRREERVPPVSPAVAWNLPPPALTERRAERAQGDRRKQKTRIGLTLYGLAVFLLMGWLAWPLIRLKLAQAELSTIGTEAARIRETALLWREGGACFDSRQNVLELLWQVSRPLMEEDPPKIEGVRLTLFDVNNRRLLLQGEGKDLEVVEKYFNWLKAAPSLAFLQWKHPQPRLLPTGNAQFQAEGSFPGTEEQESEGGENAEANAP